MAAQVELVPVPALSVHVGEFPAPEEEKLTVPVGFVLAVVSVTVAVQLVPAPPTPTVDGTHATDVVVALTTDTGVPPLLVAKDVLPA